MTLHVGALRTPIGEVVLLARGEMLVGLEFADTLDRRAGLARSLARHLGFETREHPDPAGAASRLERYFAGELGALDEQACQPRGTAFQLEVWRALRAIPAGATLSYAGLAARIGRPGAARAVGAANGANPIALFVPCHRVIAADRTPWGYGGGLARKRWLLTHEGAAFSDRSSQIALELDMGSAAPAGRR
jgi:methylated-DNA-[protein]-cysteine S-methyltransferase